MGTRTRIRVGKLTEFIEQNAKLRKKYGEVIEQIMKENDCSWTEAKKIHKFEQVENNIRREFRRMSVNEASEQVINK
jgi:mevalonate kinase